MTDTAYTTDAEDPPHWVPLTYWIGTFVLLLLGMRRWQWLCGLYCLAVVSLFLWRWKEEARKNKKRFPPVPFLRTPFAWICIGSCSPLFIVPILLSRFHLQWTWLRISYGLLGLLPIYILLEMQNEKHLLPIGRAARVRGVNPSTDPLAKRQKRAVAYRTTYRYFWIPFYALAAGLTLATFYRA